MKLPLFTWARGYDSGGLRGDVLAGLTVWAVLVPEALAYATIAGVSPVVGLYAAPGALVLYAAFGSSRHLVTGPTASTAALSAAAVGELAAGGSDEFVQLTITMALVIGILALVAGALRLGFLASFISEPVLKGFIIGLALNFVAAVAALAGVLVFDTLPGLFIGIGVSIVLLVYRASRPHIAILGRDPGDAERWNDLQRHPDNEREPGIVVVRCESALIFANADAVRDAIHANIDDDTFAVVLDAETVPTIDVTAVSMLTRLADDLRRDGIELVFARDVGVVRELVRLGESDAPLSRYPTVKAAVDALRSKAIA